MHVCVHASVCVCVHGCMHACVCVRVCACSFVTHLVQTVTLYITAVPPLVIALISIASGPSNYLITVEDKILGYAWLIGTVRLYPSIYSNTNTGLLHHAT